ncbi:MAG: NHL repeat-containing protein [Thermodesulfobacteriota bacterium]
MSGKAWRKGSSLGALILLWTGLAPLPVLAAVDYQPLAPLTHGMTVPSDVAATASGGLLIADEDRDQVLVMSRQGETLTTIPVRRPSAVAASVTGRLFVGSKEDLSVRILDSAFQPVGQLGRGSGEFRYPRNICLDEAAGLVQVVDPLDSSVRVYNLQGGFVRRIADSGGLPQDCTVVGDRLYLLDQPLLTDAYGTYRGARIRVFDRQGASLGSLASTGSGAGQLRGPRGIASGSGNTLYVSDAFHGVVQAFRTDGTYLGAIQNASQPMNTPLGLDLTTDGRLLVATGQNAQVQAFSVPAERQPVPPVPDIDANGSDGPLTVAAGSEVAITISLAPGDAQAQAADWWLSFETGGLQFWFAPKGGWRRAKKPVRLYGGPLFDLAPVTVLSTTGLPAGTYIFRFGVDLAANGAEDPAQYAGDAVTVTVTGN